MDYNVLDALAMITREKNIDRAIVIADLELAGFVLAAENDLLRNPEDDYSLGVFDPSVRGKTDRFMLLFRKPE